MWVTLKPFRYRGTSYKAGDRVPAERWASRKALVSLRKIKFVPNTGVPVVQPDGWKWERKTYEAMKRADLDAYATEQGLDPTGYSKKEDLLDALEEKFNPTDDTDSTTNESDEVTVESTDPPTTDEVEAAESDEWKDETD